MPSDCPVIRLPCRQIALPPDCPVIKLLCRQLPAASLRRLRLLLKPEIFFNFFGYEQMTFVVRVQAVCGVFIALVGYRLRDSVFI